MNLEPFGQAGNRNLDSHFGPVFWFEPRRGLIHCGVFSVNEGGLVSKEGPRCELSHPVMPNKL